MSLTLTWIHIFNWFCLSPHGVCVCVYQYNLNTIRQIQFTSWICRSGKYKLVYCVTNKYTHILTLAISFDLAQQIEIICIYKCIMDFIIVNFKCTRKYKSLSIHMYSKTSIFHNSWDYDNRVWIQETNLMRWGWNRYDY